MQPYSALVGLDLVEHGNHDLVKAAVVLMSAYVRAPPSTSA
jgi:hypothetical protein